MAVSLVLDDGSVVTRSAAAAVLDLSVDPARRPDHAARRGCQPQGALLPGLYVRVRLAQAQLPWHALPQQAVQRGGGGDTVMVVGADGKARAAAGEVGPAGPAMVVLEGLRRRAGGGRRLQKIRPTRR